jgi:heptosyltransferase-2
MESWHIGDVVLATPFLAELRQVFPNARITLLAQPHATSVLAGSGLVDAVVELELPWTHASRGYRIRRFDWGKLRRTIAALRRACFDVAFESRMDPRAKAVMALTGAERRVGYDHGGANWLLTDVVPAEGFERHRTEDWLRLLTPFGGARGAVVPRLAISESESAEMRAWLDGHGIQSSDTLLAVHPGGSHPSKRWPLERFKAAVAAVQEALPVRVVAIVSPDGYGAEVTRLPGVIGIRPGLRELMALLAASQVLLCNDSGPMHLAAAVGTPIVGIFHAHAAREYAPLGSGHHVLAPPDSSGEGTRFRPPPGERLLAVEVPMVVSAVCNVLARDRAS